MFLPIICDYPVLLAANPIAREQVGFGRAGGLLELCGGLGKGGAGQCIQTSKGKLQALAEILEMLLHV